MDTVSVKPSRGGRAVTKRRRNPVAQCQPESYPFPHLEPNFPVQRVIAGETLMETLAAKLPDGKWIAVELRPGAFATGSTKAAAEAAIRRKLKAQNPEGSLDEDAIDREVIRKRRGEKSHPISRLAQKFLK